jgi:uncharacterized membrane protein
VARGSVDGVRRSTFRRSMAAVGERLASELWPIPTAAILLGVVLGILLPVLDRAIDDRLPAGIAALLFGGGVDSARAVLGAIAGSLITATSLTFSLTVVALQLASSQASPRVLRTFSKDRVVHLTLAVFVGTFAYALTVLRTVQDATDTDMPQVPRIAVTLASVLTLASVIMLTFFLAHLSRQLRVETTMKQVHAETSNTIDLVSSTETKGIDALPDDLRASTQSLSLATGSGFIRVVDRSRLLGIAVREGVVIEEEFAVGHHVVKGTPVARWWPSDVLRHPDDDTSAAIGVDIAKAFDLAYERTSSQDIGFGIRQLVDIVVRAVSPGVNDPTTAVHGLGHLAAILGDIATLPAQPVALVDDSDAVRVILRTHVFDDLLETAVEQPRRYGASDPDVATRLFQLIREIAFRITDPQHRMALEHQLERLEASVAAATYDATERARFAALAAECRAAIEGEWISVRPVDGTKS